MSAKRRLGCKEVRPLVSAALRMGWTLHPGGKHDRLVSPDGDCVLGVPGSPQGDGRALTRLKCKLRQRGVEV